MGLREQKKAARRQAILDAGRRAMLEEGFERASVERIVAEVGIARGTFYLYFPDKETLFSTLLEELYAPFVGALKSHAKALASAATTQQQQLLYLQMSLGLAQVLERTRTTLPLHFQHARAPGTSGTLCREWLTQVEDTAITILEDAQNRGLVRHHDSAAVALAIVGAAERLLWAWLQGDPRLNAEQAASELARLFFEGIRPQAMPKS
ncbi:MAG: AcrR family transcriptional regulator [Cognaticolwellia sp.]|jgi:AcrR family transcriptional regulator